MTSSLMMHHMIIRCYYHTNISQIFKKVHLKTFELNLSGQNKIDWLFLNIMQGGVTLKNENKVGKIHFFHPNSVISLPSTIPQHRKRVNTELESIT